MLSWLTGKKVEAVAEVEKIAKEYCPEVGAIVAETEQAVSEVASGLSLGLIDGQGKVLFAVHIASLPAEVLALLHGDIAAALPTLAVVPTSTPATSPATK